VPPSFASAIPNVIDAIVTTWRTKRSHPPRVIASMCPRARATFAPSRWQAFPNG
jgi:hypothetical protein